MWLYGSGFPKSMNVGLAIDKKQGCSDRGHRIAVANRYHPDGTLEPNGEKIEKYEGRTEEGKQWQGWGTALKPAYEPIIVARKPVEKTVADNVLKYGVGGINIDECRVGNEVIKGGTMPKMNSQSDGINIYNFGKQNAERLEREDNLGRFPANVILTYDDTDFEEVCGGMHYGDEGSASRYFYTAKASKKDRDEGLDMLEDGLFRRVRPDKDDNNPTGLNKEGRFAPVIRKNTHPTVKPCELMQYLVRLVSPKGATILDCFMGSGSTGKVVMFENRERNANYKFIGIEMTEEYLPIAKARIEYAKDIFEYELKQKKNEGQITIFDFMED